MGKGGGGQRGQNSSTLREAYKFNRPKLQISIDFNREVGEKWQMDVKFVPSECKSPKLHGGRSYFQYTVIDEASRKRFLYFSDEHTASEAAAALRMAVSFFGYAPKVVQTDNGLEFCDHPNANRQARPGRAPSTRWPPA